MEEIEAKFLNIDAKKIELKLLSLGATKIFDRVFKFKVFDYPDLRLHKDASWLRLRDEGDQICLTFKKRLGAVPGSNGKVNDKGMDETEITVSDFNKTADLMLKLGFIEKFHEEKRRIKYDLNGVEVDIDTYPMLPDYIEIEGSSWKDVENTTKLLGLKWEDRKLMSAYQIYALNGIDEYEYSIITFDKQVKRKKKLGD